MKLSLLCGLFMCNQWRLWGTHITTQSIRHGLLLSPPQPCWSKCVLRVYGNERGMEGRAQLHTHTISFGTEQWNLQMKDNFLLTSNMETINLERVTWQNSCHLQAFSSETDGRPILSWGPQNRDQCSDQYVKAKRIPTFKLELTIYQLVNGLKMNCRNTKIC